jgi:hypothetical protein
MGNNDKLLDSLPDQHRKFVVIAQMLSRGKRFAPPLHFSLGSWRQKLSFILSA